MRYINLRLTYLLNAKSSTLKAKAIGPEAKAKAIKCVLEAKVWPRGLHHMQALCTATCRTTGSKHG